MSSGAHEYDEALLKAAPEIDKKQRQEGYSTDLLQNPKPEKHRSSTPGPRATSPTTSNRDLERGVPARAGTASSGAHTPAPAGAVAHVAPAPSPLKPLKSKPFYKTKKGLVLIGAVLIAIIIAAVVGGVVGSRKKNDNSSLPAPAATTTQASGNDNQQVGSGSEQGTVGSGDQQGVGGASSSGTTTTTESVSGTIPTTIAGEVEQQPNISGVPPNTRRRRLVRRRIGVVGDLN